MWLCEKPELASWILRIGNIELKQGKLNKYNYDFVDGNFNKGGGGIYNLVENNLQCY